MDKKKTGSLIKEARIKKNYTQSELGDLLGVTNKAVSRWENGESFPDVGVLESLSMVLDLKIQDIVTGGATANEGEAITEVVRLSKLQQQERTRISLKLGGIIASLCCCIVIGGGMWCPWTASDFTSKVCGAFLTVALALCVFGCISQRESICVESKLSRRLCLLSIVGLAWSAVLTGVVLGMVQKGRTPFGMELASVGPFVGNQLAAIFWIGIVILAVETFRNMLRAINIHWGYMVVIATCGMAALYYELLRNMETVEGVVRWWRQRTAFVLLELVLSIGIAAVWTYKKKKS